MALPDEREAVNRYPCPLCGAEVREGCRAESEFEAPVTHIARLSLVRRLPVNPPPSPPV